MKTQSLKRSKIKAGRVIVVILVVLGSITVLDNAWRLTKEISSSFVHTVKVHQWSTVLVK